MPILLLPRREHFRTDSFPQRTTRRWDTSTTCFPSGRLSSGRPFFSWPTASCIFLTLTERTSLPTASRFPTSWPWPWAPRFTDSWACFFPILWRGRTLRNTGPSSPRWESGEPARFPFTCISIRRGRTRIPFFLWYWERTRASRTFLQWILLGLISGLMLDVYFANGVFLVLPLIESLVHYGDAWKTEEFREAGSLFAANFCFLLAVILCFIPTLITRYIIFGGFFRFGSYQHVAWDWTAPYWHSILFSTEHGL